ncbi:FAD/NAD(P)-binding oxidoreductase [Edaphobacter aggregans]|uniref:FAD/NAD(P)-binding oxidoreductase n=1 Tax=Edaphobacter aggregans TaxID=570835 RepID=UPI0005540983|nr:FAD/NAD(P)-binding oxidoreductase [Edaphobacter aggregans]
MAPKEIQSESHSYDIVLVGGGSAGITTAAHLVKQLRKEKPNARILIIDPAENHYYQPIWTLVGAGVYPKEVSTRKERDLIPSGVIWLQEAVSEFIPHMNEVRTKQGARVSYRYLVVCTGLKLDWEKIPGLAESVGKNGVCSNYSYETVESTWKNIREFTGGTAIFTQPLPPIKCGGAPQKIMYLADSYFRTSGVRKKSDVVFCSAAGTIFSVKKYADTLNKVLQRKEIVTRYKHNLTALRTDVKEAVFKNLDTNEEVIMHYDMIHVTPPQSPCDFVRNSPLANKEGWVEVDKEKLQHVRYPNVFALGDASNLPTSKTGAAVRKQASVVAQNLVAEMKKQPLTSTYNGYTSCPLVTGYNSLVMAEFDYDQNPAETFPIDQSKERYSMYLVKKYVLPRLYWQFMLKGRA